MKLHQCLTMTFRLIFSKNIDKCIRYYENIILLGDLNFDMVNNQKCQILNDLM